MKVLVVERSQRRIEPIIGLVIAGAITLVWAKDSEEGEAAFAFHRDNLSAVVVSATTPGADGLRRTISQGGYAGPIVSYP